MALVKFGGGIIQMTGSIAGNTFARNRYGNYVRARTKPVNPNTARQVAVRAAVSVLTERWSETLTTVQRTAWVLYASNVAMKNKLGESIKLSGFNHFIRSNAILQKEDRTIVDDGPVVFELPGADPTFAVAASEATQQLTFTFDNELPWAEEDPGWMWFEQGQPQNPQRNFFGGPYRACGNVVGILGGGVVEPQLIDAAFAISEGQRVWTYARIQRVDGRLSEKFYADCIVAA